MEASLVCDYLKNSIWHAFNALDIHTDGRVPKHRLQVFIASLGNLLNIKNAEKGLLDYRSTSYLKYEEFLFYLQKEVFSTLSENLTASQFKELQGNIDDICWLICKHCFVDSGKVIYEGNFYFKWFRIFCVLADFINLQDLNSVQLNISEVNFVTELLDKTLGKDVDETNNISVSTDGGGFSFEKFLFFIKVLYGDHYDKDAVIEATNEVYDTVVENIIKKGYLKKSLTPVGPWWEMWFILKQHSLTWYVTKNRKDPSGEINLYNVELEVTSGTGNNFKITYGSKSMNLYAVDCATKFQWITAFNVAAKHSKMMSPSQQTFAMERKKLRRYDSSDLNDKRSSVYSSRSQQKLQESFRNLPNSEYSDNSNSEQNEILEELQLKISMEIQEKEQILVKKEAELENEKREREKLEIWRKEQHSNIDKLQNDIENLKEEKDQLHETLQEKLKLEETLQQEKEKLKAYEVREKILLEQLKEERQAKEDEEIVRDLQSRKLAEEWERIEIMEKEQEEKEAELCAERKRRAELELQQKKHEEEMDHLASVLNKLEKEKEELNLTLQKTKDLLVQIRKPDSPHQNLKRSFSVDFSSMNVGSLALSPNSEENC